jgi:gamma-glutamyl-gamma-aminobutyraldehyde dehydrogenase
MSIAEQFTELVINQAKKIKLGNPLDPATTMGPLVDRNQTGRVADFIASGSSSADLAYGGSRITIDGSDCYIEPTVFKNVPLQSSIATDEIFGPVLSIVSFETEAEAISIANNSIYGLAASVWTSNLSRAHRVSDALHAGTVSVNTVDALGMNIPFGGFNQSGFGRDLSLHALDKFTGLKTTWIRLIQRTWKKIFNMRKNITNKRQNLTSLRHRELTGKWPSDCSYCPTIYGMLSYLN